VGCGVLIDVRRGRINGVQGDPQHPTNRGGLCAKGQRLTEVVRTGDRLSQPMVRPWRSDQFDRSTTPQPVSWADAIQTVSSRIRRTVAEAGPDAVAFYLSGQLLTEDYYVANKLGKGLLRTANVDTNSRLCMSSTVAAYKRSFGADGPPGCYEDLDEASDVYFWGSNAADTHPILYGRLQAARQRGIRRWTVIDPLPTATALAAERHLAIRAGTDVALALALAATLFQEGLVDEAAVRRQCAGLDETRAAALAMPPETAASICGIEAELIRQVGRELSRAPAALSVWCQGLNQSSAGTDKVNALINLHLLTGQIGRPGTGPFSLTGQSNAMGGREVGGMATELAAHRQFDSADDRAEVERFWGLGPVPDKRGLTAVELVEAMEERRVRVLWVVCSNPLASLPDGWAARRAFAKLDLLVVQELYHPTDTSALADVLLPAAGWAEKTGTMTNSERRVALVEAAVAPPGEARPDWQIFAEVAKAIGGGDAFNWPNAAAVFGEHVELTRGRDLDMSGMSHELLREAGPQQWPFLEGGEPQARRYLGGHYATGDGQARLIPVAYRPPREAPDERFPLRLTTGRLRDQWHTMTRTGKVAALRREAADTVVFVSPDDAERAGLAEGEPALVSSPRGEVRARVHVDSAQQPGLLFLPFHRGPLLQPAGWTNTLLARELDPISFQPELKHTIARLEPAPKRVALSGGELARAVELRLRGEGVAAMLVTPADLASVPPGVVRVLIPGDLDEGVVPWWDLAGQPELVPPAPEGGLALLDLHVGPEALAALPALAAAGWTVRRRGDGGLPVQVLSLLDKKLPESGSEAPTLVVGAPHAAARAPVDEQILFLQPGGSLGGAHPLSGDPTTLAAFLAGRIPARAALRRLVVPLGRLALVVVGEPVGAGEADLLIHEDRVSGQAQVWRLSSGEVLGAAAVVERPVAEDVERLWLADVEPGVVRSRVPLH
jgi:assimilatory nitrate reductase catalytic subunit